MSLALTPEKKLAIFQAVEIDGLTFEQAAKFFGVSKIQAREIFNEASEEYEKRFVTRNESRRQIQDERWEEFRKLNIKYFKESERPRRTKTKRISEDGEISLETKIEERLPDPRFMKLAMDATQKISDLWGLEAPKQTQNVSHSTHEVIINLQHMSEEELEKHAVLAKLHQQGVLVIEETHHEKTNEVPDVLPGDQGAETGVDEFGDQ